MCHVGHQYVLFKCRRAQPVRQRASAPEGTEVQFKLLLPRGLHRRIAAEAGDTGRSVSEEIRQRLEASFAEPAQGSADELTGDLTGAISEAAELLAEAGHTWHGDQWTFAQFKAAVDHLLEVFRPEGESVPASELDPAGPASTAGFALGALHARHELSEGGSKASARHWARLDEAARHYLRESQPAAKVPRTSDQGK
jgi:Arc-like DNA binding domain